MSRAIVLTATQPFASQLIASNPRDFRYDLIWRKNKLTGFLNANRMPLRQHESIFVFYRCLPVYHPQKSHGHRRVWGVELVCPGGGKYVWNDKYQTMESTLYGHPGEPKKGPSAPPVLSSFVGGDFGLTLENNGLRARVMLERPAPAKP